MPSLRPAHPGWLSWWSSFLGGEERFGARRVVGDVCQADHLGHAGAQQGLDTLANSHLRQAAALTPAFQADVDPAVLGLDQDHPTAVGGDHRVDLRVQDTAHPVGETLAAACWRWFATRAHDPHAGDLGDGGAQQVPDAGGQRSTAPGDPLTSRVATPSSTATTRTAPPRAMTEGSTLRCSAVATLSTRSIAEQPS